MTPDPTAPHPFLRHPDEVPAGRGSARYPATFRDAYVVRELIGQGDDALADPSLRVGTVELPAGFVYPPHRHPAAEVYVVLTGELRWEVDGERFDAHPGSVVRHPPLAVHAMTVSAHGPAELLWVWYPATGDPHRVLAVDAEPVGPWADAERGGRGSNADEASDVGAER